VRVYDRYLATLALLFAVTTVLLAAYSQHKLDLYFSLYLIEYLAATLVFAYLHPRAHRLLGFLGYFLFAGFMVIVAMKVFEILLKGGTFS
jgi:uncharacterized membrane protein YhdT